MSIDFLQISRPIDLIYSETLFSVFSFKVNNSTMLFFLILVIVAIVCFFIIRNFKMVPDGGQVIIEMIYELIEGLIFQITKNKWQTNLILPFIGSLLIFISISNLIGNIPGLTSITFGGKSVFRAPTSDFSTTFSLAVASLLTIQYMSIRDFGILGYIGRFIKVKEVYLGFKQGLASGLLSLVDLFIGFLDIIGECAKIISISLRLFGNIFAGMVLTTVVFGMFAYVLPTFLMAMGLMFAIVQAVVFSALVTVYYSLAIKPKEQSENYL